MAKISNVSAYPNITNIDTSDYLIITDAENNLMTKTCTLGTLQGLFGLDTVIAKIALTANQLQTIFASPVTLIPSPGAGKVLDIMSVMISFDAGNTVYDFASGNNLLLLAGTSNQYAILAATLNSATDSVQKLELNAATGSQINIPSGVPLTLKANSANPTQGNGLLYLNISYRVLTVGTSF